jgi:formate dehydrogenase subunit gamma
VGAREIPRFTAAERVFHWVYFVSFVVLAVTGAFLYVPWLSFSAGEAGEVSRLLHRLFAVLIVAAPVLTVALSRNGFPADLREALRWRAEDLKALRLLLTRYYWTGDAAGLPPQGKFTAGQKLHIAVQVLAFLVMAATGLLLWFGRGIVSPGLLLVSVILHGLAAVTATSFVLVHIYMVTLLPLTKGAIASMFLGTVSVAHAREHHPRWYHEIERRRESGAEPRG